MLTYNVVATYLHEKGKDCCGHCAKKVNKKYALTS